MHDHELTAIGPSTKIEYQQDFDFYLRLLLKRSSWAISVIDYYNKEVFGSSPESIGAPASAPSPASEHRSWEDDFLQQLELPPQATSPHSLRVPTPVDIQAGHANTMGDILSNSHTTVMSTSVAHGQSISATTQLQLDISHMSLNGLGADSASVSTGGRVPSVCPRRASAQLGHQPNVAKAPLSEATKRVTRSGGKAKKSGK